MSKLAHVFVGVDISKKYLDVHLHPINKSVRLANTEEGCQRLLSILAEHEIGQIACEATGGYERLVYTTLSRGKYKVWRVEPKRIKAFIFSEGIKAKTDKIDAKMIALFASKKCRAYEPIQQSDIHEKLKNFVALKVSLTSTAATIKTQLQQVYDSCCHKILTKHLHFLEKEITNLETSISTLIKNDTELDKKADLISSIPGIGIGSTAVVLAMLPELGKIDNKQAAALVGVAPYIRQSGDSKGIACIRGGRHSIRTILYMAALTAIKHNPVIIHFYQHLIDSGKKFKVAIVAVMRKLVIYMNTLVSKEELWNPSI